MSFTLSQRSIRHLRDIVDNYMTERTCMDDLVTQAERSVRQLENALLSSNSFLQTIDLARQHVQTEGRPIYASRIVHTNSYRISLLGIPVNASIPLHDHPNMISIVTFLSGRIQSPTYRVTSKDCGYNLAELVNCSNQTYSQGDITVLTPDKGNLHSMEGMTAKAVCLSIQLSIAPSFRKQSYYFPTTPNATENKYSLWYRIPFRGHSDDV